MICRFCDQWGDTVTLVNVYKEWERQREGERNSWCVANSINAKSMRIARDNLNEIMETFKKELKMPIKKEYSKRTDVNIQMAKILFECYSSNVCRFSGHRREGYIIGLYPEITLHIHPSSALNYIEEEPVWVVYEQVLTTSKHFMLSVSYVEESWVMEKIARRRLGVSVQNLNDFVLQPHVFDSVGSCCTWRLLRNQANELKNIENTVKKLTNHTVKKIAIDVVKQRGRVIVYATAAIKAAAVKIVTSILDEERNSMQSETWEEPLRCGSRVRFVMQKGASIRTIMMPDETRRVEVSDLPDEFEHCDDGVKRLLSSYGEIETVKRLAGKSRILVTFHLPEAVTAVIEDRQLFPFEVKKCFEYFATPRQNSNNRQWLSNFIVKVSVARRPIRNFGYVKFCEVEDALLAALSTGDIIISKKYATRTNYGNMSMTIDRKNPGQTFLSKIPAWADADLIRKELQLLLGEEHAIENIILPREKPPSEEESAIKFAAFTAKIPLLLADSGKILPEDFYFRALPPREKDFTMIGLIHFDDPYKAELAKNELSGKILSAQYLDATLDGKVVFSVPSHLFQMIEGELNEERENLKLESNGKTMVRIESNTRMGGMCILLETAEWDWESIRTARNRLEAVITGHKLDVDSKRFLFFRSAAGKRMMQTIHTETTAKIRVDERLISVFVHGKLDSVIAAKTKIMEFLNGEQQEIVKDLNLRGAGYPKGLMKALVLKYGCNLEKLKESCGAIELELILRRHNLRFHGREETYNQLLKIVRELADSLPGVKTTEMLQDCPICFCPIDYDSCYIMELCGHIYCKICAMNLVENGLRSNDFPIVCARDGCGQDFVLRDFKNLSVDLNQLRDSSIRAFVQRNASQFGYCITPDCPMVYRKAEKFKGSRFVCSECNVSLCTACGIMYHDGTSCEVFEFLKKTAARLNDG